MTDKSPPRAILFDIYGTLLDVHSVAPHIEAAFPGRGGELSALWREKELQYTWLRTLSDRYADFWQVTGEALDYAVASLNLALKPADRERLMSAYESLSPFPDVAAGMEAIAALRIPLAALSNGTPRMLDAALQASGLRSRFRAVLSVDAARRYKTAPEAYRIALIEFGGMPKDFVFVSANGWDCAGAGIFGFRTFWVNRPGAPVENVGVTPAGTGRRLADLVPWLSAAQTPT